MPYARDVRLRTATIIAAAVLGWIAILRSDLVASRVDWGLYVLSSLLISADLADLGLRYYIRRTQLNSPSTLGEVRHSASAYQKRIHVKPYALLASVHNAEPYIDCFLERMEPYKDRFWFVDDASTDRTAELLRYHGWRLADRLVNQHKPGTLRRLLMTLPPEIETVVVLDPDMNVTVADEHPHQSLDDIIFDFQKSGCAAACPRIRIHSKGILAEFQDLEYLMSFELGRASLQDQTITSGAGIYNRSALQKALDVHSLSVYAEDLENAIILLSQGHSIYYEGRVVIDTDAKTTWKDWFSQRVGWYFGLLKVFVERRSDVLAISMRHPRSFYHFAFYTGFVSIILHPVRIFGVGMLAASGFGALDRLFASELTDGAGITNPLYFLLNVSKYALLVGVVLTGMGTASEKKRLWSIVPIYPLYAMAHVLPVTVGFLNFCAYAVSGSRVWQDHYQSEEALREAAMNHAIGGE